MFKIALTTLALTVGLSCIADPITRPDPRMAPLKGRVKVVRSCGYGALPRGKAKTIGFDKENYQLDSFNNIGQKILTIWVQKGAVVGRGTYKYDSRGNKVEELYDQRTVFKYNASNKIIEEKTYFSLNTYRVIEYKYSQGRLIEKELSGHPKETVNAREKNTYAYNGKGQVIREVKDYFNGGNITTMFAYDDRGRVVSQTQQYGPEMEVLTTYEYDEHDNEVLSVQYTDNNSNISRYPTEYIYDSHGNWLRRIENYSTYLDEGPASEQVAIREIEYY